MGRTSKNLALIIILIMFVSGLSLMITKTAYAQSIPKPSVPDFTMKLGTQSHDVPSTSPTYTIDPYTGQQKIVTPGSPGYHVENKAVELTIRNQQFTPYTDDKYHYIVLFYNVSYKGHFGNDWEYYYSSQESGGGFSQSNSDYTVVYFTQLPSEGGQIDFRVQAQIGYYTQYYMPYVDFYFSGQVSGWSNTQTITIGETSGSSSPNPTLSPTNTIPSTPIVPELSRLAILTLILFTLSIVFVLKLKTKNQSKPKPNQQH